MFFFIFMSSFGVQLTFFASLEHRIGSARMSTQSIFYLRFQLLPKHKFQLQAHANYVIMLILTTAPKVLTLIPQVGG